MVGDSRRLRQARQKKVNHTLAMASLGRRFSCARSVKPRGANGRQYHA
jgi:hypothetical protein